MIVANLGIGNRLVFFILIVIFFVQLLDQFICLIVQFSSLLGRAGNNQRRTRFINQNRVHFIDNRIVMAALHQFLASKGHIIA